MFRPSRNFKVPLVYGGEWKNSQTFQKWDPISKRLVQVNCCSVPVATNNGSVGFQFFQVTGGGDPNSGNFAIVPISLPNVTLTISTTDKNGQNVTTWLSTGVANSTYIKIEKDLSNYVVLTRLSSTNNTTYWEFNCNIFSSAGIVNNGDTVNSFICKYCS